MKTSKIILTTMILILGAAAVLYADTVVTTTSSDAYFHHGDNVLSTLFYFVGDVAEFPFRLLGDLFEHLF